MDVPYKMETFKTVYKVVNPPPAVASSSRVTLDPRPPTPEPLIWHSEEEDPLDKAMDDYFGSNDEPELCMVGWDDTSNVDMDITNIVGISLNFYKERLVPDTLTSDMSSHSLQFFLNRVCNVTMYCRYLFSRK